MCIGTKQIILVFLCGLDLISLLFLAEKARAAGWTQSAEDQTVWKNICTKRWSTKLPSDKIDQSNWLIPLTGKN
jgi:hypothetical protein